ncbi:FAD-binding oxidoreductase [Ornithinimicrobium panacihumi]|uniref:FAD-binding oxidoreductase n=1 Tax=Ornithinimicrobium panacihumi TaxID=2008449 RepID=UPI003F8B9A06
MSANHPATDLLPAGLDHLLSPAGDDDHVDGVPARVVARPATAEQAAGLMRACHERGLAVVVRGHGTKLAWGRPPERLDVLLDTTAMDELVEHARGDLIATVGAGMPLARLQEQLAEADHQVALDDLVGASDGSPASPGSTVGGAVAANVAGPRRMWAGTMRDLVIGVRIVRADGTIAKAGGKVVKNVAGYDLSKLVVGSFGTLALITEVTLRLHPVPAASFWVGGTVPQEHLGTVLEQVVASQLVPHAVEVRTRPGVDPAVVALVSGTSEGAAARAEALSSVMGGLGCPATVHDLQPPWWGAMLHPGQRGGTTPPEGSRPLLVKVTSRLSGVADLVAEATRLGATLNGSAGTGVLYLTLPGEDAEGAGAALASLRAATARLGGSAVVLDAPPQAKAALDSWGPVPGLDLMRRVKHEFDPGRTLAPGRFVGGL